MPKGKGLKLKDALDRHKDVDRRADHQKKIQKQAEKRKRSRAENEEEDETLQDAVADAAEELEGQDGNASKRKRLSPAEGEDDGEDEAGEGWETDSDEEEAGYDLSRLDDSEDDTDSDEDINVAQPQKISKKTVNGDADEDEDEDEDDEEDEDIPLSDIESLASEDKGDVIPHQRLTINNHAALLRAHKSIALPTSLPWSATQSITSEEPTVIADIDDDLGRELSFYKQSLDAMKKARAMLQASRTPMSRPADYFAEMVKTDEHMGKIKKKLVDEAAGKKAAADARRQRDLRKFGKQVQVAKLQERDKAKKETMEKIGMLKRSKLATSCIVQTHANPSQNDKVLISATPTRRTCSTLLSKMRPSPIAKTRLHAGRKDPEVETESQTSRGKSAMRSMAMVVRKGSRRATMQSRVRTHRATASRR